jgi:uncharacterized protein YqeY
MAELKARLQADLHAAIKNRESMKVASLRMALAGVTTEEVSGKVARELSDDEVQRVINREVRKRKEAAEAFAGAGRSEQAQAELDEAAILSEYLPAPLGDAELADIVAPHPARSRWAR